MRARPIRQKSKEQTGNSCRSSQITSPEDGFLLVQIEADGFALPVGSVREILREACLTPVPGATPLIKGVMNLRGRLVTVLEASHLLGSPSSGPSDRTVVVVVEHDGVLAGIRVDRTGDVVSIDSEHRCSPQGRLPGRMEAVARFVATWNDRLVTGLDLGRVFQRVEDEAVVEAFATGSSV